MIVTVEYNGDERTDPLENVTSLDRDKRENLVVNYNDGTRSIFRDGKVVKCLDNESVEKIHA